MKISEEIYTEMNRIAVIHFPLEVIKIQIDEEVNNKAFLPEGEISIPKMTSFNAIKEAGNG